MKKSTSFWVAKGQGVGPVLKLNGNKKLRQNSKKGNGVLLMETKVEIKSLASTWLKFSKWFWAKCNQNLENSFIYKINTIVKQIFFFFFQFESSHCLWTDQVIKIIMVDTSVLPSNKAVDLIFPVANISIFYKMSDLSLHSTLWRR